MLKQLITKHSYLIEAATDPVISGITLSKSTNNAIRLDMTSGTLYIDQNGRL